MNRRELLIQQLTKKSAHRNKDRTALEHISQEREEVSAHLAKVEYPGVSRESIKLNQQLVRLDKQAAKIHSKYVAEPLLSEPHRASQMTLAEIAIERSLQQIAKKTAMRNSDKAAVAALIREKVGIDAKLGLDDCHGSERLSLARRLKTIIKDLNRIEHRHALEPL